MAIEVGVNSYVTEAELTAYATARGITITSDTAVLLTKAMDFIETRQFIGNKASMAQPLQWPRIICEQWDCEYDNATVPQGIKNAHMIAALLIDSGEDLQSVQWQSVKREKVSEIEIEYQDNTSGRKVFTSLNDTLRPFIQSGIGGARV